MTESGWDVALLSLILILSSAYFVAAEYALVSSRRSRIESLAAKGVRRAKLLLKDFDHLASYIACCQVAITMIGIGIGSLTEPYVAHTLGALVGKTVDRRVAYVASFLLVSLVVVVVGELTPKLATLIDPERAALWLAPPLRTITKILYPLIWATQVAAKGLLRVFGAKSVGSEQSRVGREELMLLVQSEGLLAENHADLVRRALRIEGLTAKDFMIHRLDVKWLQADLAFEDILDELAKIPYSRLPVCGEDIDDVIGLVHVHDIVKALKKKAFSLRKMARPIMAVPENQTIDGVLNLMRQNHVQLLLVRDEYGGTSGLITLEDVVEEVFGELDDNLEAERPKVEYLGAGVATVRAEVRVDELFDELELPLDDQFGRDSLAQLVMQGLERPARVGDKVETPFGLLVVENMARRRITRIKVRFHSGLIDQIAARVDN